jgi:hypothetical protein
VRAFAAGALLAMVADTPLTEAYEVEGVLTGPLAVSEPHPTPRARHVRALSCRRRLREWAATH